MRTLSRAIVLSVFVLTPLAVQAEDPAITRDVVYGHKDGLALTFDVLKPEKTNGAAVIFIQSGGWYSNYVDPAALVPASKPLLDKGFTVFVVRHGSAPKYTVPEAVEDMRRSVRFIRLHAQDYGVDPERIGALGGSAGGHLALMLATTGDDGDAAAKDPVLKSKSRIAASVSLYPPTDLRGWTTKPPEVIAKIPALRPPLAFDANKEAAVSPILHLSSDDAPMLMIHGDKDELVPIAHAQNLIAALKDHPGVTAELVTIEGAAHAFNAKHNETVIPAMVNWFEKHLSKGGAQ
jgi:acetyl esterase/lipase